MSVLHATPDILEGSEEAVTRDTGNRMRALARVTEKHTSRRKALQTHAGSAVQSRPEWGLFLHCPQTGSMLASKVSISIVANVVKLSATP